MRQSTCRNRVSSRKAASSLSNWKLTRSDEAGYRYREIDKRGPPLELTSLTSSLRQKNGRDKPMEQVLAMFSADELRFLVDPCSYARENLLAKLCVRPRIELFREPSFLIAHIVRFQKHWKLVSLAAPTIGTQILKFDEATKTKRLKENSARN